MAEPSTPVSPDLVDATMAASSTAEIRPSTPSLHLKLRICDGSYRSGEEDPLGTTRTIESRICPPSAGSRRPSMRGAVGERRTWERRRRSAGDVEAVAQPSSFCLVDRGRTSLFLVEPFTAARWRLGPDPPSDDAGGLGLARSGEEVDPGPPATSTTQVPVASTRWQRRVSLLRRRRP
uniref:Uncharacterized protein n=1 Tax=Arundo donax TaxID=35708 RepID=A0A0A9D9F9_ARUDO